MRNKKITTQSMLLTLTLAGFALRLHYLATTHPFFDEYTTVLAARQILQHGWPMLPSGLFYEHGLLATYLIAPFTALFINTPAANWQPAHWGLMPARWPSLLISTATIPLIYAIGRRSLPPTNRRTGISLLAAGLFALSPEGMVWGGRARMYALAILLILLTTHLAYRGATRPNGSRYRWAALFTLLLALLSQFGTLMLIPPLLTAMLVIGWLLAKKQTRRPWFFRPDIIPQIVALALVIGLALWIKRLGQPLGVAQLNSPNTGNLWIELLHTIAYQTTFHFTWADTVTFLARQFGVPHHLWLTGTALTGIAIGLILWMTRRRKTSLPRFPLFLGLVFGLIMLEMVTLLEPFRRNPRYIVMFLPMFYLITAYGIFNLLPRRLAAAPLTAAGLLTLFTTIGFNDIRVALLTPEPAYEQAFAWLAGQRQPDDLILTMNTPAAALYLGHVDGFTVQQDADQFLLNQETTPVDRWLGAPWLGTAADFSAALNTADRAWFIIDTIRQPVYFRGDWLAVVHSQMEQVWAADNALVYRTRPDRVPIPTAPDIAINATLGQEIMLTGYTVQGARFNGQNSPTPPETITLTLFWQALTPPTADYTIFVHLRNAAGITVAQRDSQPLDGAYPTSHWQPGNPVITPLTLPLPGDLPAGTYRLYTGLYRLDTLERLPVANDSSGENAVAVGEVTRP